MSIINRLKTLFKGDNETEERQNLLKSFDYYDYSLIMNEKNYDVILTVKNVAGQGSIYYHHFLYDLKKSVNKAIIINMR